MPLDVLPYCGPTVGTLTNPLHTFHGSSSSYPLLRTSPCSRMTLSNLEDVWQPELVRLAQNPEGHVYHLQICVGSPKHAEPERLLPDVTTTQIIISNISLPLVPVTELMLRGRVRMSMMFGC